MIYTILVIVGFFLMRKFSNNTALTWYTIAFGQSMIIHWLGINVIISFIIAIIGFTCGAMLVVSDKQLPKK